MTIEELEVTKVVVCPDGNRQVEIDNECRGCDFYHGMSDLDFNLKCGFPDEKNEEGQSDDEDI